MATTLLLLVASLLALSAGAELLVGGAAGLARRLRIAPFFIGLTIVGFGTSTPELFTSLLATWRGQVDISVGNVMGSNVFNIALILGLTAVIAPIPVSPARVRSEVWAVIGFATVPFAALASGGVVGRELGGLMLLGLAAYVWRGAARGRRDGEEAASPGSDAESWARLRTPVACLAAVLVGLVLLVVGSALLVDSATTLARALGVSDLLIALTIVAGGTSAPELVTSLVAALRRQPEIALGNILGSNVFNVAGILGLAALLRPQTLAPQVLGLDAPVMLAFSLALLPLLRGPRVGRRAGGLLLVGYGAYLAALLAWAPGRFGG